MVHNNKVLTVSYGTFSCTLEGFEDSFGTMKAIAEYFRDLASDDRYFGAEPPQPDAEMLARIAQREVARQVEARTSSDGIHLRTAAPAEAPSQPAIETSPAVAPAVDTAPKEVVAEPAAENSAEIWTDEKPQQTPLAGDSSEVTPSEVDLFLDDDDQTEPDSSGAEIESVEQVEVATADYEADPEEDQEQVEATVPAATVDLATIAAISAAVSEAPAPVEMALEDNAEDVEFFDEDMTAELRSSPRGNDTVPAADSIAAKLQRIRAVVSQTPEEEFSEDEHAEAFVETARAELAQVDEEEPADIEAEAESDEITRVLDRLDLTGDLSATPAAPQGLSSDKESSASDLPESDASSSEALIASVLQEPKTDQGEKADSAEANNAEEAGAEGPARPRRRIRLNRQNAPETEATDAIGDTAREVSAEARETLAAKAAADQEQKATQDTPEAAVPRTTKPLRARIVKVKRADLEQAMATGTLEEVSEETATDAPTSESSLDAEEEADLLRELAEVEAELLASNEDELDDADASPEAPDEPELLKTAEQVATSSATPASTPSTQATISPDSDVTRLMEAAESKLEDPDNATSRETYSQLRAAVAAAEADRSVGGNSVQTDEAEPYREDLASVVRPRRPGAAGTAKASRPRGTGSRPAPLKLVAEQRIDPETTAPAKPVRPRRISVPVEDAPVAQTEAFGSFTDYVQDQGAAELHELLEAAASYLSFVEGRDHFSRPQLMNKVRSVGHGDFNRENGLRSIGLLLREGKIERSDNGNFSATDDIGFRPPKRAAG